MSNATLRIIGAQRDVRGDQPGGMFCRCDGQSVIQQLRTAGYQVSDDLSLPDQCAAIRDDFRADKISHRGRDNRGSAERLSGSQPMEKYLSALIGDQKVSATTTGQQKASLRRIVLVGNHRGCAEMPVFRGRQNRNEFGLQQSREEAWSELLGKAYNLPGR